LKSDEKIMLVKNMRSRNCYLSNKKEGIQIAWEMQDVEDFDQTNEGNNEGGRKKTSPCRHTTFRQNCAFGNFIKGLKNDLPLVIHASKLAK
jgi:hypothetical protein